MPITGVGYLNNVPVITYGRYRFWTRLVWAYGDDVDNVFGEIYGNGGNY